MKRAQRHPVPDAPTPAPTYSGPIALLALGMLGGYAALILLPATGVSHAPLWQIALGATLITLLAAGLSVYNCRPIHETPWRGRLVALICVLGCLGAVVFTRQMYLYETEPAAPAPSAQADPGTGAIPPLSVLFGGAHRTSTN